MTDPRPTPPERVPVADLIREANERAPRFTWNESLRALLVDLAAALEATAAERDRAHATLERLRGAIDEALLRLAAGDGTRDPERQIMEVWPILKAEQVAEGGER